MVAHLFWATWAIRSRSLIYSERPEQFAHGHSFDLSEMSEWANERKSDERMSEFPAMKLAVAAKSAKRGKQNLAVFRCLTNLADLAVLADKWPTMEKLNKVYFSTISKTGTVQFQKTFDCRCNARNSLH